MMPEMGHFALWLALRRGAACGVLPLVGAQRGRADWMLLARPLAGAVFVLVGCRSRA